MLHHLELQLLHRLLLRMLLKIGVMKRHKPTSRRTRPRPHYCAPADGTAMADLIAVAHDPASREYDYQGLGLTDAVKEKTRGFLGFIRSGF